MLLLAYSEFPTGREEVVPHPPSLVGWDGYRQFCSHPIEDEKWQSHRIVAFKLDGLVKEQLTKRGKDPQFGPKTTVYKV